MAKTQSYEDKKAEAALRQRLLSAKGREISPIPKAVKPKRRSACKKDFRKFCETYYAQVFCFDWSEDHLLVIDRMQRAVIDGELFALAMPRGSGKTSLCRAAAVWALLYGYRRYVVLFGATDTKANKLLENIKIDLETNDLLLQDFPEVCYPIRRLERISARSKGQTVNGTPTLIEMTSNVIVLPTTPKSCSGGSRVEVSGLTGSFRGMNATTADGSSIRPDLVLIDDPQTNESACSPKQVEDRLSIIRGGILGLAGPKKKIAGMMPCTVIATNDVADQILNRKLNPEWQGQRTQMLRSFPKNEKLWEEYAEIRAKSLQEEKGIGPATEFYKLNRAAMDDGAEASWQARFNDDEASAIQNAMNIKLRDELTFFAEYQNDPVSLDSEMPLLVKPEHLAEKIVEHPRGVIPIGCTRLTAFIDVQKSILYYTVLASTDDFTSYVVDYGTYPKQAKGYFFLREVDDSLQMRTPNAAIEGQLYTGLTALTAQLLSKHWNFDTNTGDLTISRLMIDAGFMSDVVKQFCKESPYSALLLPSYGRGLAATVLPFNEYVRKDVGVRTGWAWRFNTIERHMVYDTNSWKTFVAQAILSPKGNPGTLNIFKDTPTAHRMYFDHATAEYPIADTAMGRTVNVWKVRPNRENHWLDTIIGAYVAASEQGVLGLGHQSSKPQQARPRRKMVVNF